MCATKLPERRSEQRYYMLLVAKRTRQPHTRELYSQSNHTNPAPRTLHSTDNLKLWKERLTATAEALANERLQAGQLRRLVVCLG